MREQPRQGSAALAEAAAPISLPLQAQLGEFVRVDIGDGQPGWVAAADLDDSASSADALLRYNLGHMPPRLELNHGEALVTRESSIRLRGTATDDQQVRDLYIFAGARKVFYQANGDSRRVAFDTQIPLHGGVNYVTVFARESDDVVSRRMVVIRRDAEDGSALETPRYDDDIFGISVHNQ